MAELKVTGNVITALKVEEGVSATTGKAWKRGSFVIETHDQYPKKIFITIIGEDRLNYIGGAVQMGAVVDVTFDISSRQFTTKDGREYWSTDIMAYKIEDAMGNAQAQMQAQGSMFAPPAQNVVGAPVNPAAFAPLPQQQAQAQMQQQFQQPVVPQMPQQGAYVPQGNGVYQQGAPAAPQQSNDLPF